MRKKHTIPLLYVLAFLLLFSFPAVAQEQTSTGYAPITKIDLGVETITLEVGESYQFHVTYEPEVPAYYSLNWFVTDNSVIEVNGPEFTVTALKAGEAGIFAESLDGVSYDTCHVIVNGNTPKDAFEMKGGNSFLTLSQADRKKITAESILRYLSFLEGESFTDRTFSESTQRYFSVTAKVKPGTEEAESKRAYSLGMIDAEPLEYLHAVTLVGSLEQILDFTGNNADLTKIFELETAYLIDPVTEESSEAKAVTETTGLQGNVENLTGVSGAHKKGLKGSGVTIAVIDTGLNKNHPEFKGRVVAERCYSTGYNSGGYRNTSYNSVCSSLISSAPSKLLGHTSTWYNHGSHVTGIAAGKNGIAQEAKIVSILASTEKVWDCYSWEVEDYACDDYSTSGKCCSEGGISGNDQMKAYNYLIDYAKNIGKITAINMSFGSGKHASSCDWDERYDIFQEMRKAGMIPVVAAGNEEYESEICDPACITGAFPVAALYDSPDPQLADYSNYNELVKLTAPGTNIYSAVYPNGYTKMSGTSMATPMVTGAFAILQQQYPGYSNTKLENTLISMSKTKVSCRNDWWSCDEIHPEKPVLDFTFLWPKATAVRIYDSSDIDWTKKVIKTTSTSYQLKAVATPEDARQKFTWSSSDITIAEVSADGKVTFISDENYGTVTITATAIDGSKKSAWTKITYMPEATSLTIVDSTGNDVKDAELTIKTKTIQLKGVATPSNALQEFSWESLYESIATVSTTGKVTFSKAGRVRIKASTIDGSYNTAYVWITYVPPATGVRIQDSSGTDITGTTQTTNSTSYRLKAVAKPDGAAQDFTWKSSNTSIATVDPRYTSSTNEAEITFIKPGIVTITATANDGTKKYASVKIKYIPQATSISMFDSAGTDISEEWLTISSKTIQLKAVAQPPEASQKFNWESDNTSAAIVSSDGKVTFLKENWWVNIYARATDGSYERGRVVLKYSPQPIELVITDTNIRGKNKEIQVTIPWSDVLTEIESTLYDDNTGDEVVAAKYVERMDSTGKNKVVSWVGAPLVNGNVYRFKIRVSNGAWSNYVEKYAMPISNVYGATVVAGNKTMVINTQHREPATGTRYMVFDAATEKELSYKLGTKINTTWTYNQLTNGKLYYVVAVPYRDYKGQRLWGPNQNRIYFIPMGIPSQGKVSFSGANATISIANDSSVDGIRVLYRPAGGALKNGCEAKGAKCTIKGLKNSSAYEFYAMKYKVAEGKTYYSMGTLIPYKTTSSGLSAPQMNPVVAMNNSGYTTFTIRKSSNAEGISVLYKIGTGNFVQACEKAGNSCSTTLDISKNYTFYIMQYRTQNGKKLYSPGIVARDYTSGKAPGEERLYTGFTLADGIIDMNEIYDALDGYVSEESLLLEEAFAVMGERMVSKGVDEFYEEDEFDYSSFDDDAPYGEYEVDASDDGYEPEELYDEGIDPEYGPEAGWEEPFDEGDEPQEESEELYMYYFGNGEKPLPPAPSFGNL